MKDKVEPLLDNLTPCGAPPELRERVLNAVAQELSSDRVPPWESRLCRLVVAGLVLGAVLNLWAVKTNQRRLAELAGPEPVPKQLAEIVEIVESVAGSETGKWVQQRLMNAWSSRPVPSLQSMPDWEKLINDLEITGKVQRGEKVQEGPKKRIDGPGRAGCDSLNRQRDRHLSFRQTA